MPISISSRPKRSLTEIAKAEGVHVSTVARWTLNGVGGRKLRSIRVGGRRYVLDDDWNEFITAGMDDDDPNACGSHVDSDPDRPSPKAEQAAAELKEAGF